jgi:hypothetical protein
MSAMQSDSSSPGIENPTVGHLDIKYSTVEMFEFDPKRLSTVKSGSSPFPNSVVQTWREGSVFRLLYRYGDWEDHASRCGPFPSRCPLPLIRHVSRKPNSFKFQERAVSD